MPFEDYGFYERVPTDLDNASRRFARHEKPDENCKLRFATLINDSGDVDGCFRSYSGLIEKQWRGIVEDLECAWGVYSNDCDPSLTVEEINPPTAEERECIGGWWNARTFESINAFRGGVVNFFCYIAKEHGERVHIIKSLPAGAQNSHIQIRWI